MTDQKAENLLNLSLATPEAERERSGSLNVGYDRREKSWELIVKYNGDLAGAIRERFPPTSEEIAFRPLLGGFAVLKVPEGLVTEVIGLSEIEYAEQPKRLYFAVNQARAASCLTAVQAAPDGLTGRGVLAAVIDSGIDWRHADFRNADGSTRILYLYDQAAGRVYTREEIDAALGVRGEEAGKPEEGAAEGEKEIQERAEPAQDAAALPGDPSGHGTAVAGIFAGNGRESGGKYRGAAYESDLLAVKLGAAEPDGFPRTTQVMDGVDFAVRTALSLSMPMALNLSFGNTYGSHDGNGLLERYLDTAAQIGRSVFVAGTGNEGDAGGHTAGRMKTGQEEIIEFSVSEYETGFGLQLWKTYEDDAEIFIQGPSRGRSEPVPAISGAYRIPVGNTEVLVYYGEPGPYNMAQEIYFDLVPEGNYVDGGIWRIFLRPGHIVDGRYDLWLPSAGALNGATKFLRPVPETTLTVPSTALRPVSVGAYEDGALAYAPFSGRGNTRLYEIPKPDLAAPGVGIVTAKAGGGYAPVTGTSFAAPFAAGAAALLMEWGIIRGNDPYLYGDKVKAYLRRGARPFPGQTEIPDPRTGCGALCVADSFPSQGGR